jgi:hypothetical protein
MTTNNTFSNQKRDKNNTFCNLTEQWKKGELEEGWYYVLLFSNEEYITFIDGNWVVDDRLIGADIKEVLAPVPSYKEYDVMKYRSSRFSVRHFEAENQRLKSLLKDLRKLIGNNFLNHKMRILLNEIDEVLNVPSE